MAVANLEIILVCKHMRFSIYLQLNLLFDISPIKWKLACMLQWYMIFHRDFFQ